MKTLIKIWNILITFIQAIGMVILFGRKKSFIMLELYKEYLDSVGDIHTKLNQVLKDKKNEES